MAGGFPDDAGMISTLFWIPIGLYLCGWVGIFIAYWKGADAWPSWGRWLLTVGWGAHTLLLVLRAVETGFAFPFAFSAAAWLSLVLHFIAQRRFRKTVIGFIMPPLAVALLMLGEIAVRDMALSQRFALGPLPLQAIVVVHIVAVLAGHLLFASACLFSIVYLYEEHKIKAKLLRRVMSRFPSLSKLSTLNHRAIALGFFFLSLGILLGFLAGGMSGAVVRPISWRQIIPLLVWLVYAVFLLKIAFQGRRGHFGAIWSIVGFAVVSSSLVLELVVLFSRP